MAIKTILVPTDFSKASESSVRYARELADAFNASLRILHVVESPYMPGGYAEIYVLPPQEYLAQIEQDARERLDRVLTPDQKEKYRAQLVLKEGRPADEILNYVEEEREVDLIVMATHGRGGVARLMMGSVADKVVRGAPCPVLTICEAAQTHRGGKERAA